MLRTHLEELFDSAYNEATFKHKDLKDTIVDKSLHSILQEVEAGLPDERKTEWVGYGEHRPSPGELRDSIDELNFNHGFNAALSEVRNTIRKVEG